MAVCRKAPLLLKVVRFPSLEKLEDYHGASSYIKVFSNCESFTACYLGKETSTSQADVF